jgi:hypothetical protein
VSWSRIGATNSSFDRSHSIRSQRREGRFAAAQQMSRHPMRLVAERAEKRRMWPNNEGRPADGPRCPSDPRLLPRRAGRSRSRGGAPRSGPAGDDQRVEPRRSHRCDDSHLRSRIGTHSERARPPRERRAPSRGSRCRHRNCGRRTPRPALQPEDQPAVHGRLCSARDSLVAGTAPCDVRSSSCGCGAPRGCCGHRSAGRPGSAP